jgi:hypothetical protein
MFLRSRVRPIREDDNHGVTSQKTPFFIDNVLSSISHNIIDFAASVCYEDSFTFHI